MVKQLKDAAILVALSMTGLNLNKVKCKCCNIERFENWKDAQTAKELDGIIRKLDKIAARLTGETR